MINDQFLDELGLGSVSQDQKDKMKAHIELALQNQIGERAEQLLDDAKLDELDNVANSGDSQAISDWLQANLPNYNQIVEEEIAKLKEEIKPQVQGILQQYSAA